MKRRRAAAAAALIVALAIAGVTFATSHRGSGTRSAISVTPGSSTSTSGSLTSAVASTVAASIAPATTASTSTTAVPTTTMVAPTIAATPAVTNAPSPAPPDTVPATTPPAGTGSLVALRGRTIAIDPGHNGGNYAHTTEINRPVFIGTETRACDTTGTETNDGYTEAAYNLDVALRLRDVLAAAGAHVVMTRTTNDGWGPCIDQRAAIGNAAHADAALSIHADGGPTDGRGFHVLMPANIAGYTDDIYASSHRLGVDIRDSFLATAMPTSTYYATQGLVERTDLGGLNLSNVPKVFIETGNMRNATDASLLESAPFRQSEAQELAVGLDAFLAGR